MVFRVLDASAFYAGVPFHTTEICYTTSLVYEEIKHIKESHDVLGTLIDTKRLQIREPSSNSVHAANIAASESGDISELSSQDISILALCIEAGGHLVSDDYAISNVAKRLGLKVEPIMTRGIRTVGRWIYYCPGCKTQSQSHIECNVCGTRLNRRLVK